MDDSGTAPVGFLPRARIADNLHELVASLEDPLLAARLDASQVHGLRRTIKRLRAWLRLLRVVEQEEERRAQELILRDVARVYGDIRDSHVLPGILSSLCATLPGEADAKARLPLITARLEAGSISRIPPVPTTLRHKALALGETLAVQATRPLPADALRKALRKTYGKARKRYETALVSERAEDWHACRKQVKYLGNQLTLVLDREPDVAKQLVKQFKTLASGLGWYHDLVVLEEALLTLRDTNTGDTALQDEIAHLLALLADKQAEALQECLALGRHSLGPKPKHFLA